MGNLDDQTVEAFGREWRRFDQRELAACEWQRLFDEYFRIFPWERITNDSVGFDLGCGSGRWARAVAPRVKTLFCVDASTEALEVARDNLREFANCTLHHGSVDALPFGDETMDFGYSLGVLHHVPDPQAGLTSCVRKLKAGAPFLLYLYYRFDNRPLWFRTLWMASNAVRLTISRLPDSPRYWASQLIAASVYYPLARMARLVEQAGLDPRGIPLAVYRDRSFYTMRTDALDRFGTRLERRFTKEEIGKMMERAGLEQIVFGDQAPYWCAVGYRRS